MNQDAQSPKRRGSEQRKEAQTEYPAIQISFAPALEHRHQSNKEQNECQYSYCLEEHVSSSLPRYAY